MHPTIEPRPKKLLEQARDVLRIKHYSYRTEESYLAWMRRYILFHNKRHPKDMGSTEIEAFLSHLAVNEKVAASTQNQALCAILFLYRHVLNLESPLTFGKDSGSSNACQERILDLEIKVKLLAILNK